jgi:hypothetical protein
MRLSHYDERRDHSIPAFAFAALCTSRGIDTATTVAR